MSNDEEQLKPLRDATNKLMEHFDSVRIFVTTHDGSTDLTKAHSHGSGNFYAQHAAVLEWTNEMEQSSRERAKRHD